MCLISINRISYELSVKYNFTDAMVLIPANNQGVRTILLVSKYVVTKNDLTD